MTAAPDTPSTDGGNLSFILFFGIPCVKKKSQSNCHDFCARALFFTQGIFLHKTSFIRRYI